MSVSGTVILDESPLAFGVIRFVPNDEKAGPGAATQILEGEFQFSADDGPVIASHRVEIEATDFQSFEIDDEAAFATEVERTGESPLANNPVPAIYNTKSILTASVSEKDDQSFTFTLKTDQ